MRTLSTLLFSASLLSACGAPADANSGGDNVRGKAVELKIGETHDDFLSADQGDHTDWKKFVLAEPGVYALHAYWDEPSIDATVSVRDQFGGKVFELNHTRGQAADHWPGMKLREGEFYLELVASRGSSVYTLEITAEGGGDGGGSDGSLAPPE